MVKPNDGKRWSKVDRRTLASSFRQAMASVPDGRRIKLHEIAVELTTVFPDRSPCSISSKLQSTGLWRPIYKKSGTAGNGTKILEGRVEVVSIQAFRCPNCGKLSEIIKK